MALVGSQQPRAQEDPNPVRRRATEGRTGPQGRERGNDAGNRNGYGNENQNGDGHEDRDGDGNGRRGGGENGGKAGEKREPGNLRSESSIE